MPRRSSKNVPPSDPNQAAARIVALVTGDGTQLPIDPGKNPAAVALGRMGGKKGGKARAETLSASRRSEIARTAALKRWAAQKPNP